MRYKHVTMMLHRIELELDPEQLELLYAALCKAQAGEKITDPREREALVELKEALNDFKL